MAQMKPDTSPATLWESGTLNLRVPRLSKPGKMVPRIPRPQKSKVFKPINAGVAQEKAKTVPLSSLLRPKKVKI